MLIVVSRCQKSGPVVAGHGPSATGLHCFGRPAPVPTGDTRRSLRHEKINAVLPFATVSVFTQGDCFIVKPCTASPNAPAANTTHGPTTKQSPYVRRPVAARVFLDLSNGVIRFRNRYTSVRKRRPDNHWVQYRANGIENVQGRWELSFLFGSTTFGFFSHKNTAFFRYSQQSSCKRIKTITSLIVAYQIKHCRKPYTVFR